MKRVQGKEKEQNSMKAVMLRSHGGPEVLRVDEATRPEPGPGQVLIRVEAASVNYADIVRRRKDPYPLPTPLPAILGSEVAGHIEEIGEDVAPFRPGDPVFALFGGNGLGGYAQFALADAVDVIPLQPQLDLDIACTLVVAGVTALQMLKEAGRLQPEETVFIPGAAGGVGGYAVQLAKVLGAGLVIAGASTPERREQALAKGADHAIDYTNPDWPSAVKRLTAGRGADVVLDMTGGPFFDQSLAALAPFRRLVVYGTASREPSTLVPQRLLPLNQAVTGYYVSHWLKDRPKQAQEAFGAVANLVLGQRIHVELAGRLPLEGAAEAHRIMETRRATGKFVLKPWRGTSKEDYA
jgi:NADPH2:quinone reductase